MQQFAAFCCRDSVCLLSAAPCREAEGSGEETVLLKLNQSLSEGRVGFSLCEDSMSAVLALTKTPRQDPDPFIFRRKRRSTENCSALPQLVDSFSCEEAPILAQNVDGHSN